MKLVAVPAPLALLAFIAMGAAQLKCEPLVLDAHEFRVMDDQGKVDAVFRLSEPVAKLKMIGPNGVEGASVWVAGDGFPQRSPSDERGKISTRLGVFFSHPSIVVNGERRSYPCRRMARISHFSTGKGM